MEEHRYPTSSLQKHLNIISGMEWEVMSEYREEVVKKHKVDICKLKVRHKSKQALAYNDIISDITAVDVPAVKFHGEDQKKYEILVADVDRRLTDAKKSATHGVLDKDDLLFRDDVEKDLKTYVITAFDEGLIKKLHQGHQKTLKRSKAVLSVLTDVDQWAYYKFVRYAHTFTSGCYLYAGMELQFPHGLGDHMFRLDVKLSLKKDLPTEELQLWFRFQDSSYWETLAEGVEYTLEEKKICYYFVQDSLYVVLNSSCYFGLVDRDNQTNTVNNSHRSQHPAVLAFLTTNLSSVEENNSGRLLKNFRLRNSVKEHLLDFQIELVKIYLVSKQMKIRHHSQKLLKTKVKVEDYIDPAYVENPKISLIASGSQEIVAAASRTLLEEDIILTEISKSASGTKLKEDIGIVYDLVDSCLVSISQALSTDDSGSEVAALLSAFVVALLSRLAQLRQEIAAGVQDLLERGGSERRVHKAVISSADKTGDKTAIEAVERDKLFLSVSKLLKNFNSAVVINFQECETKDYKHVFESSATFKSNTSSQIECIPEMGNIKAKIPSEQQK